MNKFLLLLALSIVAVVYFSFLQYSSNPIPPPPLHTPGSPDNPNKDYTFINVEEILVGKHYVVAGSKEIITGEFKLSSPTGEKISQLPLVFYTPTIYSNPLVTNCHLFEGPKPVGSNIIDPLPTADNQLFQADFMFKEIVISEKETKRISVRCDVAEDPPPNAIYHWGANSRITGFAEHGIIDKWSMIIDANKHISPLTVLFGETDVPIIQLRFYVSSDAGRLFSLPMELSTYNYVSSKDSSITDRVSVDSYSVWDGNKKVAEGIFSGNGKFIVTFKEGFVIPQEEYKTLLFKVNISSNARAYDNVRLTYKGDKTRYDSTDVVGISSGRRIIPSLIEAVEGGFVVCSTFPEENAEGRL